MIKKSAQRAEPQYTHRRKHDRIAICIPVFARVNDQPPIRCEVEDISVGGARMVSPKRFSPGDKVVLEFRFAAMKSVAGTIVEIDEIDENAPMRAEESGEIRWEQPTGVCGVQFANLTPATQVFIKKLVKYLDSMKKR